MPINDDIVAFNITHYPIFKNRNILEEFHILLAQDEEHRKVFTDVLRISFNNDKI